MGRRARAAFVASMALCAASLAAAGEQGPWAHHRIGPMPEGARVSLDLDKPEFFLGENILAHYCLENTSQVPFQIDMGGDYRGASRALRFVVTATDEAGKPVPDPDPSGFFMGGISHSPTVNPKGKFHASLPLIRHCRFEKPGVYTVRATHDLGWEDTPERKIPVGEAKITLVMPTPEQARQVVEEMYRLPQDPNRTAGGKCGPYADFTALWYPVYLPILLERAKEGCEKALLAIGCMPTPEATKALVELLSHKERAFVLKVAGTVNQRLPDPEFEKKLGPRSAFGFPGDPRRRWLIETSWRPEFAPAILARARDLLAWHGDESMAYAGFMLQCLGGNADLPFLVDALDCAVARTKEAERETKVYPPPRGACRELLRAAQMLVQRGAEAPAKPQSPGQAVVFLTALGTREDFRPPGWEATCAELLRHDTPYVRQIAFQNLPKALPKAILDLFPALLADPDLDVRIEACRAAGHCKAPELREPILKAVAAADEDWLLNAATNAAHALGARLETLDILVARLDDARVGAKCFSTLVAWCIEYSSAGGGGHTAGLPWIKERWTRFLREHREELRAGRRFRIGDPALTPDLLPPGYQVRSKDGKTLP